MTPGRFTRVQDRWTGVDPYTMDLTVTIDDPKMDAKRRIMKITYRFDGETEF